eukprot:NODE_20_length_39102_cov_0.325513.p14 type:complete len:200 gc:universal NODE_20_length_39102_cov_0.325513:11235-11834(+)
MEQILDDLSARFIINLPESEIAKVERLCFQLEQAHWFYEDFIRENQNGLPKFTLKEFVSLFFEHLPFLHNWAEQHERAFKEFIKYKLRVPVCGGIILNSTLDKVLLVRGWKGQTWSFPRGKINSEELPVDCAVREVDEETGLNITPYLIQTNKSEAKYVEVRVQHQAIRLYYAANVPEDFPFETRTRKEISVLYPNVEN